jgi:excisionase family DNA binding protein
MDPGDVLNVDQVADLIHMHRETVYTLIERGEIPAVKVGRRWRIRRQDVEALLAGEPSC